MTTLRGVAVSPAPADTAAVGIGSVIMMLAFGLFCIFLMFMYFLPTLCAILTKHPQVLAIGLLNFLLGWTVIGWVASFVWAFVRPQPPVQIVHYVNQPSIPTQPAQLPPQPHLVEPPPISPSEGVKS